MSELFKPVIILSVLGILFAILLVIASKIFFVPKDKKVESVEEILPGVNCGGCGYLGCSDYAKSVVSGEAKVNACPVGGNELSKKIAIIMGVSVKESVSLDAKVLCQGSQEVCINKFEYQGPKDCLEASAVGGGGKGCMYGCLGYGSCVKVCKFGAISVNEQGIAVVDSTKCTGCRMCAKTCPRKIIKMVPKDRNVHVFCNSKEKNKSIIKICKKGCIRCNICVKNCPHGAIYIDEKTTLPQIDYKKCTMCNVCVEKCPRKTIVSEA